MVQIPNQKRRKWDAKSHERILTGFDEETKGYRLYDPKAKSTIISREVVFLNEGATGPGTERAEMVNPTESVRTPMPNAVVRLDIEQPMHDQIRPEPEPEPTPHEQVPDENDVEAASDKE